METSNLSDAEFETLVIRMLNDLSGNFSKEIGNITIKIGNIKRTSRK